MFKLTFFSNFLNHHQLPFCLEMARFLGDGFRFVATEPTHQERIEMGYAKMNTAYPFVVRSYEDAAALREAKCLGNKSDVVIIGSAPELFVEERIIENKLTFRYSERIFKKGRWKILSPGALKFLMWKHLRFKNKQLYMLCASAYTAGDFNMLGAYRGKTFKWGYFPEVREHDLSTLMANKKGERLSLLWAGRFLDWKHPEKALHVARYLRSRGIDFSLKVIGGGDMDSHIRGMANSFNLNDSIEFLGFIPPEAVRSQMERADIYLFTSDYFEGWGAVLNEAMNSGCAVIASHAIGSVPFLIKDGDNGLIYRNSSMDDLYVKVMALTKDSELRARMGKNAYQTMIGQWNARVAAERLITVSESLLSDKKAENLYYVDGPCSVASPKF